MAKLCNFNLQKNLEKAFLIDILTPKHNYF